MTDSAAAAVLIAGPNLTIDRTLTGAALRPGEVLRFAARASPGGKGVNVARGAQALGAGALLVALLPGHTGAAVGALIGEEGIALLGVPCGGEVRSTAVVLEPDGRSTVLNEQGPEVRPVRVDGVRGGGGRRARPAPRAALLGQPAAGRAAGRLRPAGRARPRARRDRDRRRRGPRGGGDARRRAGPRHPEPRGGRGRPRARRRRRAGRRPARCPAARRGGRGRAAAPAARGRRW